eukprot:12193720-Heterocapsa_arctica.AAC.1
MISLVVTTPTATLISIWFKAEGNNTKGTLIKRRTEKYKLKQMTTTRLIIRRGYPKDINNFETNQDNDHNSGKEHDDQ